MAETPTLFLLTGIMAAGKSTVGQALAERFERGVHLRGDLFRRSIVAGRAEMSPEPSPEALAQLSLRYRLAADVAGRYLDAGFTTVVQDTMLGPMLREAVDANRSRRPALVVLAPTRQEVARREAGRAKTGYGAFTPEDLDRVLREETPRLGLWLDTTSMTVAETVDTILARADEAVLEP